MNISNAYTGRLIHVDDPDKFLSLDEIRGWVQSEFNVPVDQQLLLVAQTAVPLKLELIAHGTDVVMYDKWLFNSNVPDSTIKGNDDRGSMNTDLDLSATEKFLHDQSPPDTNPERLAWAAAIYENAQSIYKQISILETSIGVIKQGVEVAARNLRAKVNHLQKSFESKVDLAVSLDEDVELTLKQWQSCYDKLSLFSFYKDDLNEEEDDGDGDGDTEQDRSLKGKSTSGSLRDLLDLSHLENKSQECVQVRKDLRQEIQTLDERVQNLKSDMEKLNIRINQSLPKSSAKFDYVMEDLSAVYTKISKDVKHLEAQPPDEARHALRQLHATEFLPMFPRSLGELRDGLSNAEKAKKEAQNTLLMSLSKIAEIENVLSSSLRPQVTNIGKKLQTAEDLRVIVAQVIDLPYLYGLLLVEKLARNVWVDKMRGITSSLAEKLADLRSTESDRRHAIFRDVQLLPKFLDDSISVGTNDDDLPEMEVTIRGIKKYGVTAHMVKKHIETLKEGGFVDEYNELTQKYQDDIANMTSQLKVTTLTQQQSAVGYEQKINGYELRIKKLESLLLRQQAGNVGYSTASSSPVVSGSTIPTLSSTNSGNTVSISEARETLTPTSAPLLERIYELEESKKSQTAEIANLKAKVSQLESAIDKHETLAKQADLLKADLLANMTTKEMEFVSERNELTRDLGDTKLRSEHLEEELETCGAEVTRLNSLLEEAKNSLDGQITSKNRLQDICRDLSQKLYTSYVRGNEVLQAMGLQAAKDIDGENGGDDAISYKVNRVKGLRKTTGQVDSEPPRFLYWMNDDEAVEDDNFTDFLNHIYVDYDIYRDAVSKRFSDVEHLARKLQRELKGVKQTAGNKGATLEGPGSISGSVEGSVSIPEARDDHEKYKIALRDFRVGDLALFLPTKEDRTPKPWAAFNIGAPHYFLKPMPSQHLESREYLVARITNIEERVVDKTKDDSDTNPFDLSDGLKWYFLETLE